MENKGKAETYIGFAIRAGKYRTGINTVRTLKIIELLIVCKSATENSTKDVFKLAESRGCKLLVTKDKTLAEMVHRENVKVMAITDKSLAAAILENAENFTFGN